MVAFNRFLGLVERVLKQYKRDAVFDAVFNPRLYKQTHTPTILGRQGPSPWVIVEFRYSPPPLKKKMTLGRKPVMQSTRAGKHYGLWSVGACDVIQTGSQYGRPLFFSTQK